MARIDTMATMAYDVVGSPERPGAGKDAVRVTKSFGWVFDPAGMDIWDPRVIEGERIRPGAKVRKIGGVGGSAGSPRSSGAMVFVWIEDEAGNKMTVGRGSVKSARAFAEKAAS